MLSKGYVVVLVLLALILGVQSAVSTDDNANPLAPGQAGAAPGLSGDNPGHGGVPPGQSGSSPGHAGNNPGQAQK